MKTSKRLWNFIGSALVISVLCLSLASTAFAGNNDDVKTVPLDQDNTLVSDYPPKLEAHQLIVIQRFDRDSQTYHITLVSNPTAGPLDVTPEDLAKAVTSLDLKKIKSRPDSIVDSQLSLDHPLPLQYDDEMAERRKKFKDSNKEK